ncbi:MAG: glycosyltransferase family 2 protein [Terrimicrobiaceae bacterium]|nr:glycosyltransferase family 2 protein [Terrimicrobiaceae bacterium]
MAGVRDKSSVCKNSCNWHRCALHPSIPVSAQACVSVVIPLYNEAGTLGQVVGAVLAQPCVAQVIIVDDGSTDGSYEAARRLAEADSRVEAVRHERNSGKGAAVRTGLGRTTAGIVLIQDADLEYDPADYPRLIQPILEGDADVVFGSRFIGSEAHRVLYFWHSLGNNLLTLFSNMVTNMNLTDMECCYKVFRRSVVERFTIEEDRFGIEPEITAKVARLGVRIYEVSVSYRGRTYAEGKKIGWKDGVRALVAIVKYGR